jgi:hypothetical protein
MGSHSYIGPDARFWWATHLPGRQMRALERCETNLSHEHALNFGRSLILNARQNMGITLQPERNARVT